MDLPPPELEGLLRDCGEPSYRARQLFAWLHKGVPLEEMSDLPTPLRRILASRSRSGTLALGERRDAPDGAAKFAFRTSDEHIIETVLIPHSHRSTVCVSSQIGCDFRCRFCATGRQGLTRNLTAGEIVEQVVRVQQACRPARVSNLVFMGMGEPLANYQAVLRAVRILNHPWGLNIAARHIAISTCGLPQEIRRLAEERLQLALAISLHAATDEVRNQLAPINRLHPIADVIAAAKAYAQRTGRKVACQYVVIPGLNDTREQAQQLAELLRDFPTMVNLIPHNPISGSGAPDRQAAERFARVLRSLRLEVAVRRSRGGEVLGACGQLRSGLPGQNNAGRDSSRPA